jgi:Two component regulator propeller
MIGFLRIVVIRHCSEEASMMNTVLKSLIITFLAVSILISAGLTVDFVGAQNTAASTTASRRPEDQLLSPYLKFSRLTSEDGLSSDQTRNVFQDKRGLMRFGTLDGLTRYDGASVKEYRHDPDDPTSLSHNIIRRLFTDQSGILWIGTWA